ncbi:MAG: hypothetical protein OEY17_07880 [Nitrosopumilus sp.]|nr:hypothetical protein [Nitrosopumilus sp.]MDH5659245.1 hypothetical protein [Nitrosopumilus sp.]
MKTILLITTAIVLLSILAVIIIDSANLDRICQDSGGKRMGDTCLAPIIINSTNNDSQDTFSLSQIKTMKPNSMELFYYPNVRDDSEKKDTYKLFMLIRLPEWMGGNADDASAFRAYSAKSLDDACIVKYWPDDGRQRIENPCQGGMYRISDGAMTIGAIHMSVPMTALPYLDLSSDDNGLLYVEPPSFTKNKNGVIGYGKEITHKDIMRGSQFYIDSFEKSFPEYPKIPIKFAGMTLAEIKPDDQGFTMLYSEFAPLSQSIEVNITKCNCGALQGHYSYDALETIDGVVFAIHDTRST